MCGISGIVGRQSVSNALLESIRNLDYRGYDSCGVAIVDRSGLVVRKDIGTVDEVNRRTPLAEAEGCVGIAHTRWATHGEVTRANAHPHLSCDGDFGLVHNGIIANYRHLREELVSEGHVFHSRTDTETIVHLVEKYYRSMGSMERAFCKALGRLEGSYAVALVSAHEPDRIYCARFESPLLIGLQGGRFYVQEPVYDRFLARFTEYASAIKVGDGLEKGVTMGPLANARRLDAMESIVQDSRARGAKIVTGGKRRGNQGYFFEPTVVTEIPDDSKLMTVEPFGPIAPVVPFKTFDEVVERANSLEYGLAAYAFTASAQTATAIGDALESGMVGVNSVAISTPETPFGGVKESGYGHEGGIEGLEVYMHRKFISQG